jgi:hypothetical protein
MPKFSLQERGRQDSERGVPNGHTRRHSGQPVLALEALVRIRINVHLQSANLTLKGLCDAKADREDARPARRSKHR